MPSAPPQLPPELQQAIRLQQTDPLAFFVPTGHQEQFLKLTTFVQGFSGGNWAGKTTTLIAKLGGMTWPYPANPFLAPLYDASLLRPLRGRWFAPHTVVETDLIPCLKAWLPRGKYLATKGGRPFESQWRLFGVTGAARTKHEVGTFDILTYDQNPEEAEGVKLDWAAFNEPPPEALFKATIARMKPHGIILLGMTPLSGAGYLYDKLEERPSETWQFVYADVESACLEHGTRGYLPHDAIAKKIAEYDPEEREARASGKPLHRAGQIFKEFSEDVHVIPDFPVPADWTRAQMVDPHDRKPYACLWWAVDPRGHHWLYDEFPNGPYRDFKNNPYRPEQYRTLFQEKEAATGGPATTRIMDARFGPRADHQTGTSLMETFDELGLTFDPSYKDAGGSIEVGHQAVRELLAPCQCGELPAHPRLRVFQSLQNTRYAFRHYTWDDFRHQEGRAPKEKPKEEYKDFMDCVRYGAVEGFTYALPEATTAAETSTSRWVSERTAEMSHATA